MWLISWMVDDFSLFVQLPALEFTKNLAGCEAQNIDSALGE